MTRKQRTTALYTKAQNLGLTFMDTLSLTRARKSLSEIERVMSKHPDLAVHIADGRLWIVRRQDIREGETIEAVYHRGMEVTL